MGNIRAMSRYSIMENRDHSADTARKDRPRAIAAPSRYEGVGNALRAIYDADAAMLPEDMRKLLARLN